MSKELKPWEDMDADDLLEVAEIHYTQCVNTRAEVEPSYRSAYDTAVTMIHALEAEKAQGQKALELLKEWQDKRKEIEDQPLQRLENPYQRRFRVEQQLAQIDEECAEDAKTLLAEVDGDE